MRFLRRSLTGLFLLGLTLALLVMAGNTLRLAVAEKMAQEPRSFGQRERVASVDVVTVTPETIAPEMTVFGEIRALRTLLLRSPVAGTVIETDPAFVEGGSVESGQLLVKIDPTNAQSDLFRAEADQRDAEAELRDAESALEIARDSLTEAQGQADLRQAALDRAKALRERGTATAADVETAELAVASAQSSVLSQRNSVAQAEARVDQAMTSLDRVKLTVEEAERTVADTDITANFDGTLSGVSALQGGRVTANEQIAELIDPSALEVAFRVSTAQYVRLLADDGDLLDLPVTVALEVSGFSLETTGRITRESATVGDGQTGRLLYAQLDPAPGLRPGDFVSVKITEPELTNVASVPSTAVGSDGGVLALGEDNRLEFESIELLRRQGDDVIIAASDLAGRQIVATRSPLLGSGIKVEPVGGKTEEAAEAPEMIDLDDERRAKLVAFVTASQMPDEMKSGILAQLEQPSVPAATVERLESRMGG